MITRKKTALLNPSKYSNWSRELLADRDCVLAAVQHDGLALSTASDDLRADREVVLTAVQQNAFALQCASNELRADRWIVLTAVTRTGRALYFASGDLRANREVVFAAVRRDGWALECASKDLRADREVVLAAVKQSGGALWCADEYLRADREVVLAAVQQDGEALQYADKALRQDERFVAELADVCPRGIVWRYKPQVTLAETARKAMRSRDGLRLLSKQAKVSLLGEPAMMKELLLSAVEHSCLEEVLQTLIAKQKKGILNALRTVMTWYGVGLPDALPTDTDGLNALCTTLSEALVSKK